MDGRSWLKTAAGVSFFMAVCQILHVGLIAISSLYLLCGLFLILTVLTFLGILEEVTSVQGLISDLVFLTAGVTYAIGTILSWREMKLGR
jgi:hypothetical protein